MKFLSDNFLSVVGLETEIIAIYHPLPVADMINFINLQSRDEKCHQSILD